MRWPWRARLSFKPIHRKKSSQSLLHTVVMEAEGSTLLGNERGSQLHPRLWMFLGCSFVVIGRAGRRDSRGTRCARCRLLPPAAAALDGCAVRSHCRCPAGLVNVVLAALWHFWLGVALGFGVAKMGTSLCGMTLAARPPPPPARGCFGWVRCPAACPCGSRRAGRACRFACMQWAWSCVSAAFANTLLAGG